MPKILEIVAEPFSNGGQEAFIMNVIKNIDMRNLSIDILTPYYSDNSDYKRILRDKNCHIYSWNLDFQPGKSRLFYIKLFRTFLKRHKYDVVHIHSGSISALAYISFAAKLACVNKIIVHSHCTGLPSIKHSVIKAIANPLMKYSATDFFACSRDAGLWKFSKRICDSKLCVVKNGIDIDKFEYNPTKRKEYRNKLGISEDEILLCNVGRYSNQKNQPFLLDILNELKNEKKQYKLLLIGSGELQEEIERKIKKLSLESKVLQIGNVNNVNDYLQAADIFLLPSIFEGLGIVAIEAQASGLSVIASSDVPRDIEIIPSVKRLSLRDKDLWIKNIRLLSNISQRVSAKTMLTKAGYDIKDTCRIIRNKYMDSFDSKPISSDEIKHIEFRILQIFKGICEANDLYYTLCGGTLLGAVRHKGFIPWDDDIDVMMYRSDYSKLISLYNEGKITLPDNIEMVCFENGTLNMPYIKFIDKSTYIVDKNYNNEDVKNLWIDVFPVDNLPDDELEIEKIYKRILFMRRMIFLSVARVGHGKNIVKKIIKPIFLTPLAKMIGVKRYSKDMVKTSRRFENEDTPYVGGIVWGYGPCEKLKREDFFNSIEVVFEGEKFKAMSCWDKYLNNLYGDYMQLPPEEKRINHCMTVYLKDKE